MWILMIVALLVPSVAFAQAPKCEDQLALSTQLLQDFNQDRGRLQVESAALKVQNGNLQREVQEMKAKQNEKEEKGKKK